MKFPLRNSVLKNAGVNRISLGVQTFDAKLMDALGRKHGPDKIYKAYDLIQKTNFESVNLDLIFGIGQSLAQWETDMMHAVDLKPNHLSTYCLTFEEDTALYAKLSAGEISIDPEREAEFYELRHGRICPITGTSNMRFQILPWMAIPVCII